MTLWIIFAVMTAAANIAVVWPLGQNACAAERQRPLVYQDQLQEVGRDRAAGLIGETEAESARVEISRRLLAASGGKCRPRHRRLSVPRAAAIVAIVAIVIVPAGCGRILPPARFSEYSDQSAFGRRAAPQSGQSVEQSLASSRRILRAIPKTAPAGR